MGHKLLNAGTTSLSDGKCRLCVPWRGLPCLLPSTQYSGWPQHLNSWATKGRGAGGTGPSNTLAGPFAACSALPLPSQLDGQQEGHQIPQQAVLQREHVPEPPQDSQGCSLPRWPGLGMVLPPEGRRSGEQHGSAALARPPSAALS